METTHPRLAGLGHDAQVRYLLERARMMVAAGFWVQGPHGKARPGPPPAAPQVDPYRHRPRDRRGLIELSVGEMGAARYVGGCAMGSVVRAGAIHGKGVEDPVVVIAVGAVSDAGRELYPGEGSGAARRALWERDGGTYWNDREHRTPEDVLAAFDLALTRF